MNNQQTAIRDRLLSNENIFLAIYLVNSYIQNKELFSLLDQKELVRLKQVFDMNHIKETITKIRSRLSVVLDNETDFFEISVYFKPKKYQNGHTVFRPLHTAPLLDQIAMIAMLQVLVYDISPKGKLLPSELSRLLPSNFYGNIVSYDGKHLFCPWQDQYREYTAEANRLLSQYSETKEYNYEVNLDLENFFPSINPRVLYPFICSKLPLRWQNDPDILKILKKLLIFIFLCKWFVLKNEYLLKELAALKTYLNSVSDYFFTSEAKVNVKVIANTGIPNDVFDYLRAYVDTRA